MIGRAFNYERFVGRVHRRQVGLHLVERAGLGVLGGCAAGFPLVGILLWRGMPVLEVALTALGIGAAAGALWGMLTRPSRFAATVEADRQLGWADLLSSALLTQSSVQDDPWAAAVRAAAEARCREVSPSAVVLHRLGARTWGGIGLAAALVLALGMIPSFTEPAHAGGRSNADANPLAALAGESQNAVVGSGSVPRRSSSQQEPEDPNSSTMQGAEVGPQRVEEAKPDGIGDRAKRANARDSSSGGAGASQSKAPDTPNHLADVSPTKSKETSGTGNASGGSGKSSERAAAKGEAAGNAAGASQQINGNAPPWESSQWEADSQRANSAVESGRIPDSYRDVIRGYFGPP